jgi:5-methylcytosine-specific restriction protein A
LTTSRYCETHAKQEVKRYNRQDRDPDSNKRYSRTWEQLRATFLSANPLCVMCRNNGKLTPATLAHHKVKLTNGGTNDWDNMTALCHECHSRLHAGQGDYF